LGAIDDALECAAAQVATAKGELAALLESLPELREEIGAMLTLAHSSERLITPIIAVTSASGTLLRRKLEPVLDPLLQQYATLRKTAQAPAGGAARRRVSGR